MNIEEIKSPLGIPISFEGHFIALRITKKKKATKLHDGGCIAFLTTLETFWLKQILDTGIIDGSKKSAFFRLGKEKADKLLQILPSNFILNGILYCFKKEFFTDNPNTCFIKIEPL
jgi:hypothetical protein